LLGKCWKYFFKYQKEAEMKGYNDPSILCAILLFGAVLVSPAFAEMEKVDDTDLSQINASVTGASDKDSNAGSVSAFGTFDNTVRIFYPWDSKASEGFSPNVPSLGPETWTYNFGANNPNYFGSLTGVKSR
jgi:hypothetical protein